MDTLWLQQQKSTIIETLIYWSETNSGTFNQAGLIKMSELLLSAFAVLNAESEVITLAPYEQINDQAKTISTELGPLLTWVKRPQAAIQILLCGHMDTVYSKDHPFQKTHYLDENTLNGPGVADMKGGLLVILYTLLILEKSPAFCSQVGWRLVINPDEEIGSPCSAPYLKKWASDYHYGFVFEPSLTPEGVFAGDRKGSGNFTLIVHGQAAHVGREFEKGKNAIVVMSLLIEKIHALNQEKPGVIINIGYCHGGGALNNVPDLAICKLNIRTIQAEDEIWFLDRMADLLKTFEQQSGCKTQWEGHYTRQPKIINAQQLSLYNLLKKTAEKLQLTASWQATGGCCDGNNLAAAGLANIDTLGVRGGNLHSPKEYILLDSLIERILLTTELLENLGAITC